MYLSRALEVARIDFMMRKGPSGRACLLPMLFGDLETRRFVVAQVFMLGIDNRLLSNSGIVFVCAFFVRRQNFSHEVMMCDCRLNLVD
jgi:hypothetical protein